ncbi:MAG: GHMP kinase, partial [Halobacteriales archaeon]|nr:GHMP kinase [Halobacteriales archaeon]
DEVDGVVMDHLLPALAEGDAPAFGWAVETVGRLNGAWYAGEQGGVYRPPVGAIVDAMGDSQAVFGAGQSSWGPTVYAVTDRAHAEEAVAAGEAALETVGESGTVQAVAPRNVGAAVEMDPD